jgi:dTDP-4-dehydrorhamnose 3,5-epimerase
MKFKQTKIPDVLLIEPEIHGDQRGFLLETYQLSKFAEAGITEKFIQDNHSGSQQHTLRGLHYQIRHPQGKLVRVISGEVFDVAVDVRRSSPSYGRWVGVKLSAENKHQLWVPPGFAHGFYVISEWAEVVYKLTDIYAPRYERTIAWNDPEIGIEWPIPPGKAPLLSDKDLQGKRLQEAEVFE